MELQHHLDHSLSDHDPVSISFHTKSSDNYQANGRKSSYFKANAAILSNPENITLLKQAWERGKESHDNPHRQFSLACGRLRARYKEIQATPKYSNKNKEVLKARLATLKADLEEEATIERIADWTSTTTRLKDTEMLEAHRIQVMSRAKWAREGNGTLTFLLFTSTS